MDYTIIERTFADGHKDYIVKAGTTYLTRGHGGPPRMTYLLLDAQPCRTLDDARRMIADRQAFTAPNRVVGMREIAWEANP